MFAEIKNLEGRLKDSQDIYNIDKKLIDNRERKLENWSKKFNHSNNTNFIKNE